MAREPDVDPRRFALKYDPPTLVMEYGVPSQGAKLCHLRVHLRKLSASTVVGEVVDRLVRKHPDHFGHPRVRRSQIERLVGKLVAAQQRDRGSPSATAAASEAAAPASFFGGAARAAASPPSAEVDLNKVSDEENRRAKAAMDVNFERNRLKPGDPGYVYDVRKDFEAAEECEWDEELSDGGGDGGADDNSDDAF